MQQTIRRRAIAVAAALLAGVVLAPAAGAAELLAQARPPAGTAGTPPGEPPSIDQSIAQLHQQLRITPAQERAFQAFARIMRENAQAAQGLQPPGPQTSAVEGLRLSIRAMQQELAGLQRMLPALQTLYNQLSPPQRRTADQLFNQPPPG